jgi:hypothetical protein
VVPRTLQAIIRVASPEEAYDTVILQLAKRFLGRRGGASVTPACDILLSTLAIAFSMVDGEPAVTPMGARRSLQPQLATPSRRKGFVAAASRTTKSSPDGRPHPNCGASSPPTYLQKGATSPSPALDRSRWTTLLAAARGGLQGQPAARQSIIAAMQEADEKNRTSTRPARRPFWRGRLQSERPQDLIGVLAKLGGRSRDARPVVCKLKTDIENRRASDPGMGHIDLELEASAFELRQIEHLAHLPHCACRHSRR